MESTDITTNATIDRTTRGGVLCPTQPHALRSAGTPAPSIVTLNSSVQCGRTATVSLSAPTGFGPDAMRERMVAAKAHVALFAYVSGHHAWSPPIC